MPHELDANITQAGIDDALSKTTLEKENLRGGKEERLTCAQVKKSWRRRNAKGVALFFTRGTVGGNANKPQTTDQKSSALVS